MPETPAPLEYRLLTEFRRLFEGRIYKHRASNQGDFIAMHLYEDLVTINRSPKLTEAVMGRKDRVLNVQNKRRGVAARRGDGTFGELIPGEAAITDAGYLVPRGPIATVEIGVEVKILAKAMIKQIDRVINDLRNQVAQFKRGAETRFRSRSLESTMRRAQLAMKGTVLFLQPAAKAFCTPSRRPPKLSEG